MSAPTRLAVPLGARIEQLGTELGDRPAVVTVAPDGAASAQLGWAELARSCTNLANLLLSAAGAPELVMVSAHASIEAIVQLAAVLSAGHIVLPTDPRMSSGQRERLSATVRRAFGEPVWLEDLIGRSRPGNTGGRLVSPGGYLLLTGGSTGAPKPVLHRGVPSYQSAMGPPLLLQKAGWSTGQRHLVVGPLHHAAPFRHLVDGMLSGNTLVFPDVFEPRLVLELFARYGVEWTQLTPTHMRMLDPLLSQEPAAFAHLRGVLHTSAPCPPDTKLAWIDAVGPDRLYEMYAATEGFGQTLCNGREWLERPGTVGRGFLTQIRICDDAGRRLPANEIGTVYMRSVRRTGSAHCPGTSSRNLVLDGFRSVGDLGRLDEDGYLYLAGRADDLVIVGGENVYTDEITSVLLSHPDVADAAVVGIPDEVLGTRLAALVVPRVGTRLTERDIIRHCMTRLAAHQVPMQLRLVADLERGESGKLSRERVRKSFQL